ncbi:MAG: toll/interleukin-1 receptor domain-containing protein, partial [Chloroflexi bacterium]
MAAMQHAQKDYDVFVSYSRKNREFVHQLKDRLERNGLSCWLDTDEMKGDEKWRRQILEALSRVRHLLLVLSPHSLESDVVEWEWKNARYMGVCVQPVVADGYTVKDLQDKLKRWMSDRHIHSISDDNWETLIAQLKSPCVVHRVPKPNAPSLPQNYVQRDALFLPLKQKLLQSERDKLVAMKTSLQGGGGFGKTTLAAALCHDPDIQDTYDDGIYWITVGQKPDLYSKIAGLYRAFTGQERSITDDDQARHALDEVLSGKDVLLVLDDVWREEDLALLMHGGERCVRIVTTRVFDVALQADDFVDVKQMSNEEATLILKRAFDNPLPEHDEMFGRLAKRLGGWPLLLNIAASALRKEYNRHKLAEKALFYLESKLEEKGIDLLYNPTAEERLRSVSSTLAISFEMLKERSGELPPNSDWELLFHQLGVFAENENISLSSVAALWGETVDVDEVIRAFADLSLLDEFDGEQFRLHDVIRSYCISKIADTKALHARLLEAWGDPKALPDDYAWRYWSDHMIKAGNQQALAAHLLDFGYLYAKLKATDPLTLLVDFVRLPREG